MYIFYIYTSYKDIFGIMQCIILRRYLYNMALQLIHKEHEQSTFFQGRWVHLYYAGVDNVWNILSNYVYIYNICKTAMIPKIHNLYIISIIKLCNFNIWCKMDRNRIMRNEYVWRRPLYNGRNSVMTISSLRRKTKYPVIGVFFRILTQTYSYRYDLLYFFSMYKHLSLATNYISSLSWRIYLFHFSMCK